MLSLKKTWCRHCGAAVWIIDGDETLLIAHLKRQHRRS